MDGRTFEKVAGEWFEVRPGASVTMMPEQSRQFGTMLGTGRRVLGEFPTVGDEPADYSFHEYSEGVPAIGEYVV